MIAELIALACIVPLAADVPRALDDGLSAQFAQALHSVHDDVRTNYFDVGVTSAMHELSLENDVIVTHVFAKSFETTSDDVLSHYKAYVDAERKRAEEEERKRAEEAAVKLREEEALLQQTSEPTTEVEQTSVGDDIAWLAAHVATGAYDVSDALTTSGDRLDDMRCMSLYALMDAAFASNGVIFSDTDDADVIAAILSCACDETIITSGDAQGGITELIEHMQSSDVFQEVNGEVMPGDVVTWGSHVGIYVGENAAHDVISNTSGKVLCVEKSGTTYPWLGPSQNYTRIFRPVKSSGLDINWRGLVS